MDIAPKCHPPEVGTIFVRDDDHVGREEASVVWRNVRSALDWTALLMTGDGRVHLESARFTQVVTHNDWRPRNWRFDPIAFRFCPPDMAWDVEESKWVELEVESPEAEEVPPIGLPERSVLPKPEHDEHHATWKARCRRRFPALDSVDGAVLLGEVWNEFKSKG